MCSVALVNDDDARLNSETASSLRRELFKINETIERKDHVSRHCILKTLI